MDDLEASWRRRAATLPHHLREVAAVVPLRLRITERDEQGWGDFVQLEPNRDLPAYALEDGSGVTADELARYSEAHRCGGYHGLLLDRLADGQAEGAEALAELLAHAREWWRDSLVYAVADPRLADAAIESSLRVWRAGTIMERRALTVRNGRGAPLAPERYVWIVCAKLRWIGVAARLMVRAAAGPARARAFRRVHDRFLLGLQCLDDAVDGDEDRALFGRDYASALDVPPEALVRAAAVFTRQAEALARRDRFDRFAAWLAGRAAWLEGLPAGADLRAAFAAAVIAQAPH